MRNLFLLKSVKVYKNFSRGGKEGGKKKTLGTKRSPGAGAGAGAGLGWARSPGARRGRHFKDAARGEAPAPYMAAARLQGRPMRRAVPSHVRCHDGTDSHFLISGKLRCLRRALHRVFGAKRSLPHVPRRLAFVHKVILVGKKSRSAGALCVLYVKWISLAGPRPGARSTRWARGARLCRGTGGLTHSNFLAPDQIS